jgi:DNA-binding transcriptional regulator YiaG
VTAHPNRSGVHAARNPTPEEIRAARDAAGLSSAEAGALLHTTGRVFQQWAAGERRMHPAFWELFLLKSRSKSAI